VDDRRRVANWLLVGLGFQFLDITTFVHRVVLLAPTRSPQRSGQWCRLLGMALR